MTRSGGERERALVALAQRQHGVVALWQLRALGLSGSAVRGRLGTGRLHPVQRGVYAVGRPDLSHHGRWMAAILACGGDSLISHRSAGALHGLLRSADSSIDVTLCRVSFLSRPGVRIHYSGTLTDADRAVVSRIPCTSVPRTLLDLAGVLSRLRLERACDQAEVLRVFDMAAMEELLSRSRGRRGVRNLRAVLGAGELGEDVPRSELEERFLRLCSRAGLPRPSVNSWVMLAGEYVEADFVWHERRVVVEVDGYRTHGTRQAFRRDRRRDQLFACAGWRHVRFTWDEVSDEAQHVAHVMRRLLPDRAESRIPSK